MADIIVQILSQNLQAIRKRRGLTLQQLAELSGVSKSMLGEIERGTSSASITVLWKIANGLKIPLASLLEEEKRDCLLVRESGRRILNQRNGYTISLIFEYDQTHHFELYHLMFEPASICSCKSHQNGVFEYIMVYMGTCTVLLDGVSYVLKSGDSLAFDGVQPHTYRNDDTQLLVAYSIIYYPNSESHLEKHIHAACGHKEE